MADKFTHICFISVLVCQVCNGTKGTKNFPLCCFLKIALFPYFNQLFCVIFFLKHTTFHFSKDMDNINQMLLLTPQKLKSLCLMKFSKFALFLEYENHFIYLSFQFCTTFFQIMIALIYVLT